MNMKEKHQTVKEAPVLFFVSSEFLCLLSCVVTLNLCMHYITVIKPLSLSLSQTIYISRVESLDGQVSIFNAYFPLFGEVHNYKQ